VVSRGWTTGPPRLVLKTNSPGAGSVPGAFCRAPCGRGVQSLRCYGAGMSNIGKLRDDLDAIRSSAARDGVDPKVGTLALLDATERVGVETVHELSLIRQALERIADGDKAT
jgi:hypothetical protein